MKTNINGAILEDLAIFFTTQLTTDSTTLDSKNVQPTNLAKFFFLIPLPWVVKQVNKSCSPLQITFSSPNSHILSLWKHPKNREHLHIYSQVRKSSYPSKIKQPLTFILPKKLLVGVFDTPKDLQIKKHNNQSPTNKG